MSVREASGAGRGLGVNSDSRAEAGSCRLSWLLRKSNEAEGRKMLYKRNCQDGQCCRSSIIVLKQFSIGLTCSWGPGGGQGGEGHPSGDTGRTKAALFMAVILSPSWPARLTLSASV